VNYDWNELAFGSKKPISNLNAIFIAAPREISTKRFTQLIKDYLPKGNVVLGLAKEPYVYALEDQPQFKMLQRETVQSIINKVNSSNQKHQIYTLNYFQRDFIYILQKLTFQKIVLVNGSWYKAFHLKPEYYQIIESGLSYEKVSPFADENEARKFAEQTILTAPSSTGIFNEEAMLEIVDQTARLSYDFGGYQTAVALARKTGNKYSLLTTVHNKVVPYETYSMHHGAAREKHFSPINDLNYYDTIHAETALLIKAHKENIELKGTTLFINLLPCPTCARVLVETDIVELVYRQDHSDGYAIRLFEQAGKKTRRIV
jgi:deoxycytidylate deaminase